jgi:hypothetical protein
MRGSLIPDRVWQRIGAVAEPREGLGQRQRRTLGVSKVGRIAPGSYRERISQFDVRVLNG